MRHFLVSWHKTESREVTEMELAKTIERILGDKTLSSQIFVKRVCPNCHSAVGEATYHFNVSDGISTSRLKEIVTRAPRYAFCPYCGAKLDEA